MKIRLRKARFEIICFQEFWDKNYTELKNEIIRMAKNGMKLKGYLCRDFSELLFDMSYSDPKKIIIEFKAYKNNRK